MSNLELLNNQRVRLIKFGAKYTRNEENAEEVLQISLMRFYTNEAKLHTNPLSAFMTMYVHELNCFLSHKHNSNKYTIPIPRLINYDYEQSILKNLVYEPPVQSDVYSFTPKLTPREKEYITCMQNNPGMSMAQVSRKYSINIDTFKAHVRNAKKKVRKVEAA